MTYAGAALAAAAVLLALGVPEAQAQDKAIKSRFTSIDLKFCIQIKKHTDGGSWRCTGLPGYPVYFAEGDSRQMISFGPDAEQRRAAQQTLGAFNNVLDAQRRGTIEWRFERRGARDVPYATIVRHHTARDGAKGEVLVVSKVAERESCHVAYIDALANADAMAIARSWADKEARNLDCAGEPRVVGHRGKSPM